MKVKMPNVPIIFFMIAIFNNKNAKGIP
jgi:hypothetical protein